MKLFEIPKVGYYEGEKKKLVGVTSALDFALGIPPQRAKWIEKQTVLAVQREQKRISKENPRKFLTQVEALDLGKRARLEILGLSQQIGKQTHSAIEATFTGNELEVAPEVQPYIEAYLTWASEHTVTPILLEEGLKNEEYGYAGRMDFYGLVDGVRTLIDFKTTNFASEYTWGLQLSAYRRCIEDKGYPVEQMMVLHLSKQGASVYVLDTPFKCWEAVMTLLNEKMKYTEVEWYLRTDEAAIEAQKEAIKKEVAEATPKSRTESAPNSNLLGHQFPLEERGPSPSIAPSVAVGPSPSLGPSHLNLVDRLSPSLVETESLVALETPTTRNSSQLEVLVDETSSRKTDFQPDTSTVQASSQPPRILRDPSGPPLERHTSVRRPEETDSELDIPPTQNL